MTTEHKDACGITIQERINQALTETLPDIGQIDKPTKAALNRLVKKGLLSKGKGGPFPKLKTVYAVSGFDFEADRRAHVNRAMALAYLDECAARLRGEIKPKTRFRAVKGMTRQELSASRPRTDDELATEAITHVVIEKGLTARVHRNYLPAALAMASQGLSTEVSPVKG